MSLEVVLQLDGTDQLCLLLQQNSDQVNQTNPEHFIGRTDGDDLPEYNRRKNCHQKGPSLVHVR